MGEGRGTAQGVVVRVEQTENVRVNRCKEEKNKQPDRREANPEPAHDNVRYEKADRNRLPVRHGSMFFFTDARLSERTATEEPTFELEKAGAECA